MELLNKLRQKTFEMLDGFLFAIIVGIVCFIPLMLVWNWVVPAVFGMVSINLQQSFLLCVLSQLILTPYSRPALTINSNKSTS